MYKSLIWKSGLLVIFIFFTNIFANLFYWYSSIWWFDMFMHTLGGVFLALVVGAIFSKKFFQIKNLKIFWIIFFSVFIIGLLWEGYEYVVQYFIKNVHLADFYDSISDLICDLVGGVVGTFFVIRAKRRYNTLDGSVIKNK